MTESKAQAKRPALGRGLGALIPGGSPAERKGVMNLGIEEIRPNRSQPRRHFDERQIEELAESIRSKREDLNPVEEAEAYKRLIEEHGLTQEELAARVGKERSTVANSLRLLRLPDAIKEAIVAGQLSMGHARALLAISDEGDLRKAAEKVIAENLSVRAVEALVQRLKSRRLPGKKRDAHDGAQVRHLVEKLQRRLGARVGLRDKGGKGVLEIRYGSLQELDRVLAAILGE